MKKGKRIKQVSRAVDPSFFAVLSIAVALAAVLLLLLTGRSKAFALEIPSGYGLSIDQLCAEGSGITLQGGQTYLVAGPEGFVTLARVSQTDSLDGYTFNIATRREIELSVTYDENQKVVLSKSFFGIGNAQHPFRGTISMLGATDDTALKMTDWKVLFNNLSSKGSVQSDAAGKKLVAQEDGAFSLCDTITIEPDSAVLNISGFSFARKTTDSSGETTVNKGVVHTDRSAGLVAARVTGSGSCQLDLTRSFVSGEQYELNTTSGDAAGLFAAIDSDAAIAVTLPADIDLTVSTASGHAGLLAGENKGTLTVNGDVALHGSATASGDDFAAGLVGYNKKVAEFTGPVKVSAITASGDYAGGIVGRNEAGASVTFASDASLTAVNATGRIVGGVAGLSQGTITAAGTCTVSGGTFTAQGSAPVMGGFIGSFQPADSTVFDHVTVTGATFTGTDDASASHTVGGYFGLLTANADVTLSVDGASAFTFGSVRMGDIGGVIGKITGSSPVTVVGGKADAMALTNTFQNNNFSGNLGGAVGTVDQNARLKADRLHLTNTMQKSAANMADLVGVAAAGAVVDVAAVTYQDTNQESVLVSTVNTGTVVRLSGALKDSSKRSKHIVRTQSDSLLFADTGFSFARTGTVTGNDVGNYGQILRNDRLGILSFDSTSYQVTVPEPLTFTDGAITLASAKDAAKLALTLQTHGAFIGVDGISKNNYTNLLKNLLKANISLTGDVDLCGSGVEQFTCALDVKTIFTGTIVGGSHTLTLAIGESIRSADGRTNENIGILNDGVNTRYFMGAFSSVSGAKVESLTVAGEVKHYANAPSGFFLGGVSSHASGVVTLTNCTTKLQITLAQGAGYSQKSVYVGGFIGSTQNATLQITGSKTAASIRHENGSYNINEVYLGGMVGKATTGQKVDLTNNIISAAVTQEQSRPNAYVGGCIAILECSNYVDVDLTGTSATAEASVSAKSTTDAGGLIGHTFDKCRLVLDGAWQGTVSSGSGSAGGLLYKLNGKLTANENFSVDGAKFTSGGAFKGAILGDGTTAFVVIGCAPENMKNIPANFDLFAGRNISASASIGVAANGGLVTVETSGAQIGQIPSSGGWPELMNAHSNALTRYYFNIARLDRTHGDKHTPSATVSSPADLIYWNVYDYIQGWDARTKTGGLPDYVKAESFPTEIQNITGATKDVDLKGYSFYPTKKEAVSFDFSGRTLTFGRTVSLTGGQFAGLQGGVFSDVTTDSANITLSFKNVTLAGALSPVGDSSGAFLCGKVEGLRNTTVNAVVTATVEKVFFDGLSITGRTDTPLLLNRIGTNVNCSFTSVSQYAPASYHDVSKITAYTGTNRPVAGSLIGSGGMTWTENGAQVNSEYISVTFSDIVFAGEDGKSIFTSATLFREINCTAGTGSFVYNFKLAEDWDGTSHKNAVTYGQEISTNNKQYEYYDQDILVDPTSGSKTGDKNEAFLTGYLVYVKNTMTGGVGLRVNQKSVNFDDGWGTYEHPYIISSEKQLVELAELVTMDKMFPVGYQIKYPHTKTDKTLDYTTCDEYAGDSTVTLKSGNLTLSASKLREYLRGAYFKIVNSVTLPDDFIGIGNANYPFHGVITGGSSGAKTVITMPDRTDIDKVGYGFINAANGCGVYGLEFQYGDLSLSSSSYTSATSRAFAATAKTEVSHFGGVISWVIGGDNVLDNVSVTVGRVTPGHKTSVFGGYVGLVTGGGVTVRDLPDTGVNVDNFAAYYYYNPYVGKVLSGYVLSDDAGADKAYQNTNKNFSIPHITKTAAQTPFSGNTITLADSDDLFMLSFGVSGGALGYDAKQISYGQGALSRHGDYSKVGTENLSQVKTDGDLRSGRYEDDLSGGGNSIFNAYFGVAAGRNLKGEKLTLNLTGENYDMRAYPNAFRGLGSPYSGGDCFTFAVVKGRKDTSNAPLSTVTLAVDLKQYYVSGAYEQDSVYNLAFVIENSGNSNKITYNGLKVSGNLSLSVMDAATGREIETKNDDKSLFCLAGFAGFAANAEFTDVAVENLSVHSPGWAAGLVASEKDNTNNSAVKNCKITGLNLLGRQSTGAVYGFLRVETATKLSGVSVSDSSICTRSSQIVDKSNPYYNASAGGLVGAVVVYDNNSNGKIEISDSVIAHSSIVFETSALYSGSRNGHAGGFIGSSANSASFTNCTLDSTVVLSTSKWNDAGKYPTEYTASSVEMAGVSAQGVKNAMAYALSSPTAFASGNAGGFLGAANKTNTFTACKITSDTSATVILGYQNGGGMVGNGPDGAAYTFTNVTIQATNSPLYIFGRACAAGLLPWDNGKKPITANHVKVAGSGDSALLYILSNKNREAWASGFFGNFGKGGNAVTMTDAELTGCVIAAMEVAGIANRCNSTSATFSNIRISGNYLQVIGRDPAAGAVSKVQNTTTIDGLYLADNTIRQAKNAGNAGALAAIVDSGKILNGYDILMKGNDVGYFGSLKTFPQILSASGMLELKGASGESQDKAGLVAYRNSGTVNVLALSSEDDQYPSIFTGNKGRIVFAGYGTPSLYEKKYAQDPAYTPKQALADHGVTPDGLAEILNGDPLTSQGAVFTPDYLNEKLRSGDRKTWSDTTFSQDSTELYKLSYFAPGIAKNADLPVFHITGRTNLTVSGLLNLITNGGYGSMSGAFQVQSLQANRYTLNSDGTLTLAENGTGDGSVRYENGRFTAGKYDDLRSNHKTLTVLTLTLADTAGAHTYSMNLVVYYPQILQYKSNISPLEGEQYQLSPFLNNSSYTMSGQDKRFHLDINAGSKFTFYMEYAYNDVAKNIEGYNFGKYVFSRTLDSETQEGGKFAVGTKFVLIDLNSPTASGYKSYYGQVEGQSTARIDLSSFRRGEDVAFREKLLEEIVDLTPGGRLNADEKNYPYVERYLMAVIPPETDTEQKQFNLCAKVKDNDRNIIVERDEEYCAISVWAPPTGNIAFTSTSQTFSNTADTALKTDVGISETFWPEYIAAMKRRALYGTHVFTIVDSSGAAVQFPAGTVVRLTAADGTVLQTTTVVQSTSSVKYSVGDTISKVDSQNVYSDSFTISFDFSAASPLEFGRSFPKDAKFTVQDQFYLSGSEEHYSDGARVSDSTNSITAAEVSPVKLAIVPKDRKRLAINFGDLHETTDDGKITFDLTADFSAVLAQGVENSRASVDFSVVKKTYDEAARKHIYTEEDLLSAADSFVSVSTADAPVSGSSALTIDADGMARGAYELAVDLSAVERLLQNSREDQPYDLLTNYRLVANVTLTGRDTSTGKTVHYTATGYFVFLLCNIHSGVA